MKSRITNLNIILIMLLLISPSTMLSATELNAYVRTNYPPSIKSVDQLVNYILDGTGYRVYNGKNAPDDSTEILNSRIPHQPPSLVLSRKDAILLAIGSGNSMVVDHDNKFVAVTRSLGDE